MAGDDEDSGATAVTEGAATAVVLGGGDGDGETGPLVGSTGGGVASDELREAAELRCSGEDACRQGGGSSET